MFDDQIIPIPIRDNLVVRVAGIPWDLTPKEAERISRIILALAKKEPAP